MENKVMPRILVVISNMGDEKKIKEIFDNSGVPIAVSCPAQGTAPSSIMDIFGLSGRTRVLTAGLTVKKGVEHIFKQFIEKLSLTDKGRGIAFTIPLTGLQSQVLSSLERANENTLKGDEAKMSEKSYSAILASCTNGYSEDVFEAARRAGAAGGTIIKGMREVTESVSEALGLPLVEEQDLILIIAQKDLKKDIMSAIIEDCGVSSDAHTTVMSVAIEDVLGLR